MEKEASSSRFLIQHETTTRGTSKAIITCTLTCMSYASESTCKEKGSGCAVYHRLDLYSVDKLLHLKISRPVHFILISVSALYYIFMFKHN